MVHPRKYFMCNILLLWGQMLWRYWLNPPDLVSHLRPLLSLLSSSLEDLASSRLRCSELGSLAWGWDPPLLGGNPPQLRYPSGTSAAAHGSVYKTLDTIKTNLLVHSLGNWGQQWLIAICVAGSIISNTTMKNRSAT